jgi:hypothetical protein
MKTDQLTTTTCANCGYEIPESLVVDALCVACRYRQATRKPADRLDAIGEPAATEYEIAADKNAYEEFCHASQPEEPRPANDGLDLEPVLAFLISDAAQVETVGERVLMLAYLMPLVHGRPNNIRELGDRLGCSHTAALKKVSRLKAVFIDDLHEITGKGFQPQP